MGQTTTPKVRETNKYRESQLNKAESQEQKLPLNLVPGGKQLKELHGSVFI